MFGSIIGFYLLILSETTAIAKDAKKTLCDRRVFCGFVSILSFRFFRQSAARIGEKYRNLFHRNASDMRFRHFIGFLPLAAESRNDKRGFMAERLPDLLIDRNLMQPASAFNPWLKTIRANL
ncbi:MAG: hypothetical protein Q9P14_05780 [candidate division KSB1 bacterium]|nr:hypothetical protein [candidate division KSB1 bacterium]MDQ7064262.1 hypothetical protein [candidate division KSB1 bacterium]